MNVEFVSPYPMQDCIQRIKALKDGTPPLPAIDIVLWPIDDTTCGFRVNKWQLSRWPVYSVEGTLSFESPTTTRARIRQRLPLYMRICLCIFVAAVVLFPLVGTSQGKFDERLASVLLLLWAVVGYGFWSWLLRRQVESIRHALTIPIPASPSELSRN